MHQNAYTRWIAENRKNHYTTKRQPIEPLHFLRFPSSRGERNWKFFHKKIKGWKKGLGISQIGLRGDAEAEKVYFPFVWDSRGCASSPGLAALSLFKGGIRSLSLPFIQAAFHPPFTISQFLSLQGNFLLCRVTLSRTEAATDDWIFQPPRRKSSQMWNTCTYWSLADIAFLWVGRSNSNVSATPFPSSANSGKRKKSNNPENSRKIISFSQGK